MSTEFCQTPHPRKYYSTQRNTPSKKLFLPTHPQARRNLVNWRDSDGFGQQKLQRVFLLFLTSRRYYALEHHTPNKKLFPQNDVNDAAPSLNTGVGRLTTAKTASQPNAPNTLRSRFLNFFKPLILLCLSVFGDSTKTFCTQILPLRPPPGATCANDQRSRFLYFFKPLIYKDLLRVPGATKSYCDATFAHFAHFA